MGKDERRARLVSSGSRQPKSGGLDFIGGRAYSGGEQRDKNIMQISKRDYFAAAALTGLLARTSGVTQGLNVHANAAAEAFAYADEMMKLSKTLLDPIEFDPDKMSEQEEAEKRQKEKK